MNDLTIHERLSGGDPIESAQRQQETLDIVEYWRAVAKRRWSILGLTFLVAVLAMLVVNAIRPTYRGTATLLIEQGKSRVVSIEEVYNQGFANREYYQTQVEILKSEELARRVVAKLNLTKHPDYDPRQQVRSSWAPSAWFGEEKVRTEEDIL
jgi:succinoglycan biosynthesis transport protein ExoP